MRALQNVTIEITNACNLHCKHCGNDAGKPLENELSKEEIFNIIDQLEQLKVKRIGFTGGEPFCHPLFFDYLAYAKDKIPTISIASNGYDIDEEKVAVLSSMKIQKFAISLDGMSTEHNALRGSVESFQRAVNAIQLLVYAGMEVKVRSVLTRNNQNSILDLIQVTNDLGIKRHEIIPTCPLGRGSIDMCLTSEEYYLFLKAALEKINHLNPVNITYQLKPVFHDDTLFAGTNPDCREKSLAYICDAFDTSLEITSTGGVIGCSFVRQEIGNIRQTSIIDLWNSPQALLLYDTIHNHKWQGECQECDHNNLCNGGCYANKLSGEGTERKDHYCFVKRRI